MVLLDKITYSVDALLQAYIGVYTPGSPGVISLK